MHEHNCEGESLWVCMSLHHSGSCIQNIQCMVACTYMYTQPVVLINALCNPYWTWDLQKAAIFQWMQQCALVQEKEHGIVTNPVSETSWRYNHTIPYLSSPLMSFAFPTHQSSSPGKKPFPKWTLYKGHHRVGKIGHKSRCSRHWHWLLSGVADWRCLHAMQTTHTWIWRTATMLMCICMWKCIPKMWLHSWTHVYMLWCMFVDCSGTCAECFLVLSGRLVLTGKAPILSFKSILYPLIFVQCRVAQL